METVNQKNQRRFTRLVFQEPSIPPEGTAYEEPISPAPSAPASSRLKKRRGRTGNTKKYREISTPAISIKEESPWKIYNANMRVKLDMWLAKAVRRDGTDAIVAIRTFSEGCADRVLQRYRTLDHHGLVTASEVFLTDDTDKHLYVVSEYLPICLDHVVDSGRRPTDGQLASIMGQVNPAVLNFSLKFPLGQLLTEKRPWMRSLICILRV